MSASAAAVRSGWGMRAPHREWLDQRLTSSLQDLTPAPRETAADHTALVELRAAAPPVGLGQVKRMRSRFVASVA